jgi:hypothetical protein
MLGSGEDEEDIITTAEFSGLRVRASNGYLKALAGRHCKPGQSEVVLHGPHDILLLFQASGAQQVRKAGQFEKGDIGMLATHGAAMELAHAASRSIA